jgi:hypothetical protein
MEWVQKIWNKSLPADSACVALDLPREAEVMKGERKRRILVLLDSPEIRREGLRYSVELAQRTGAEIVFLMLLRWENLDAAGGPEGAPREPHSILETGESALLEIMEETRGSGVKAGGEVRQGDPTSELLKFLTASRPYDAVVWIGNESFLCHKREPVRGHWLERIRDELDCALVVPCLKTNGRVRVLDR